MKDMSSVLIAFIQFLPNYRASCLLVKLITASRWFIEGCALLRRSRCCKFGNGNGKEMSKKTPQKSS